MTMRLLIPSILLAALVLGLGYSLGGSGDPPAPLPVGDGQHADLQLRLVALEDAYLDAMNRIADLEATLAAPNSIDVFGLNAGEPLPEDDATGSELRPDEQEEEPERRTRDQRVLQRIEQAGLSADEYDSYEQRAYQLYLENFQQEWLQRREAYLNGDRQSGSRERLREELGDDAYDRYLFANGSSNRVRVRTVMPGSAAQQAGLTVHDVVLAYDGERLFTFEDLRAASYRGEPGELATLEVRRADGTVTQVTIPRGPMGISGSRGWREPPGS